MKQLSKEMLIKLTQIDYDREIALVAIMGTDRERKMVGVCRVIDYPDGKQAEFAMAITDGWQGKGIGAGLLRQCLKASWEKGLERVNGLVLAENTQMLKLAKKLGFRINRASEGSEYELIIERNELNIE
jgi:acetyltransferase